MAKKLLHTLGYNEEGCILHVDHAEKGNIYTCPQCGDRIIARNSGMTQRPHFAHFKKSEQCNGESVLHHLFCQKAIELLQNRLQQKQAFMMEWSCPLCNRKYSKNLLQQVSSLSTETVIEEDKPDISLLDGTGQPLLAIKVMIRKRPTKKILHAYEERGIILILIQIEEEDWQQVEYKLAHPECVTFCGNSECYNYQFYSNCIHREYYSQKFKCKKCGKMVDGYMVRNTSALGIIGLDRLRDYEKQEIVSKFFRGKRATVADILVYGKCRCVPHSKGLVCLNRSDDFKETRQGKISKKK